MAFWAISILTVFAAGFYNLTRNTNAAIPEKNTTLLCYAWSNTNLSLYAEKSLSSTVTFRVEGKSHAGVRSNTPDFEVISVNRDTLSTDNYWVNVNYYQRSSIVGTFLAPNLWLYVKADDVLVSKNNCIPGSSIIQ